MRGLSLGRGRARRILVDLHEEGQPPEAKAEAEACLRRWSPRRCCGVRQELQTSELEGVRLGDTSLARPRTAHIRVRLRQSRGRTECVLKYVKTAARLKFDTGKAKCRKDTIVGSGKGMATVFEDTCVEERGE
jgi:hypothetical protein